MRAPLRSSLAIYGVLLGLPISVTGIGAGAEATRLRGCNRGLKAGGSEVFTLPLSVWQADEIHENNHTAHLIYPLDSEYYKPL